MVRLKIAVAMVFGALCSSCYYYPVPASSTAAPAPYGDEKSGSVSVVAEESVPVRPVPIVLPPVSIQVGYSPGLWFHGARCRHHCPPPPHCHGHFHR